MSKTKTISIILISIILLATLTFFVGEFYLTGFDETTEKIMDTKGNIVSCETSQDCINVMLNRGVSQEDLNDFSIECNNNECGVK